LRRIVNRGAVASLILSRVIYAINWYNIAAVFTFIAADLHQNVSGLGVLTASFYGGLGLFQVPGGILAAKYGAKNTATYGTMIASVASFLTAFCSGFDQLVLLRFIVGIGMALFFGPGITLVAKAFREGSQGIGVGAFNGAYYGGGALGLFAWSVLAESIGWRASLGTSGAIGILGGLLLLVYLPRDEVRKGFTVKASDLKRVLSSRWLLALSLELFGVGSGSVLINTFMVYYLEQSLKLKPISAGVIGSLSPFCAVFASPLCGALYDRTKRARLLLFFLGLGLAFGVGIVSFGSVYSAVGSTLLAGASSGAFTVAYLAARDFSRKWPEYETLAVNYVNSVQMLAGFWSPVVFSMIAVSYGYGVSWLGAAAYTFVLISIILLAKDEGQRFNLDNHQKKGATSLQPSH